MHKFLVIALLTSAASGAQALGSKDFDNFVTMKHSKGRDGTGARRGSHRRAALPGWQ
jgi:hypothetical protein